MKKKFNIEENKQILENLESSEHYLIICTKHNDLTYSIDGDLGYLIGSVCDDNPEFYDKLKIAIKIFESYKKNIN